MLYVIMEYLTLDGRFTKLYGYHFMLANHFRHDVRINFYFYLRQSLNLSIQAIQKDLNGEHVCHEGLMVLIMNVLKSKKAMKPKGSLKAMEYDMEGNLAEKDYDLDTQDDAKGSNKSLKRGSGCSSQKKKKIVEESDFDHESDFVEESVRDNRKKRSGHKGKGSKGYQDVNASSPFEDEPLTHQMERKQKSLRR